MNQIQGAFRNLSQSCVNYGYATKQNALSVVVKFKELRSNPDCFQKVCQIASITFQLIMMQYPLINLTRLSQVFIQTAGMHDFYRFIQYPRNWFSPINADSINEFNALQDLNRYLAQKIQDTNNQDVSANTQSHKELAVFVENILKEQLTTMSTYNDACPNVDNFISQLQKRLKLKGTVNFTNFNFDFSNVDLSGLNKANPDYQVSTWIRHIPMLEKITSLNWAVVDIVAIAWWAKEWKLIDTAKHAMTIGQHQAFKWIQNTKLESWLIGFVCSAYVWKLVEAVRKLRDEALTAQEKRQARWDVVTSLAELIFFGTTFTNLIGKTQINNVYVQLFALAAKSLGLLSILTRPNRQFFQPLEIAKTA